MELSIGTFSGLLNWSKFMHGQLTKRHLLEFVHLQVYEIKELARTIK